MLVSGWSGAWGMPKPVQQAFAPGSVFTYEYAPSDAAALQNWLQQLALHGVGERVAEGYGQFAVCSRYHHGHRHHAVHSIQRRRCAMKQDTITIDELVRQAEAIVREYFQDVWTKAWQGYHWEYAAV
jgi:hypothetical protein